MVSAEKEKQGLKIIMGVCKEGVYLFSRAVGALEVRYIFRVRVRDVRCQQNEKGN
jgi:hypothetical protein